MVESGHMDQYQNPLSRPGKNESSSGEDDFQYYARPLTAKLLQTMELNKNFYHGEGDYLFYEKDNKIHRVLDLTGGYGANILGHRHPRILARLEAWKESGAPSLTQGSSRKEAGKLAKRLSDSMLSETGEGPWITTLSNSGTEAVEAAYKHCLLYFKQKLTQLSQEIEKEINQAHIILNRMDDSFKQRQIINLRKSLMEKIPSLKMKEERKSFYLHQLANVHSLEELVSLIREVNRLQLSEHPLFLALEKSYHGKTMGALSLTYNQSFRNSFFLDEENNKKTIFISQYLGSQELEDLINDKKLDLILIAQSSNNIGIAKHSFSLICGSFVEPIQGEAGIVPVEASFLTLLKKYSLQEDFLLVFDEIQSGMYRTGTLSAGTHSHVTADVYTFSKSLGGGVAKIAATVINSRKYIEEFGFLHTSTFAEDDFSSGIALEVLDILQGEDSPLDSGLRTADYLQARLEDLKSQYPEIIRCFRGKGMMLALEFHNVFSEMGFEFKGICDSRMQGYMMASALLNLENLRMSPSLSNNLTLRIQPSIYFSIIQVEELISGLQNLCQALRTKNISYFLSCIYPGEVIAEKRTPDLKTERTDKSRPLAVFLCHLIDENHIKKVSKAVRNVQTDHLLKKLSLTKDVSDFEVYHVQTIKDNSGAEMDVMMLGVPVTSSELKKTFTSNQKHKVIEKVQRAVDLAKELGASTVGLGQFTSIVSGNGMYLNPRGMNLTTGNAFTIALTIEAALKAAEEKNLILSKSSASVIGAAGNIMSVASSLIADRVQKLILIHHSPIDGSLKFQETTKKIINEIATSDADSKICQVIKRLWKNQKITDFLELPEVKEVFEASSDITRIKETEIVLCGTSSSTGFLTLDLFRENSVIVDIAVPPSIKSEMLDDLRKNRLDLTYILGGVAQIPQNQSLDFFLFPLDANECFACMAETFSIGFSGKKGFLNIGDLDKNIVLEVQSIAREAGFTLGKYKTKSSL